MCLTGFRKTCYIECSRYLSLILSTQHMNFFQCSVNMSFYARLLAQIPLQIRQSGEIWVLPINTHRRLDTAEKRIGEFKDKLVECVQTGRERENRNTHIGYGQIISHQVQLESRRKAERMGRRNTGKDNDWAFSKIDE